MPRTLVTDCRKALLCKCDRPEGGRMRVETAHVIKNVSRAQKMPLGASHSRGGGARTADPPGQPSAVSCDWPA